MDTEIGSALLTSDGVGSATLTILDASNKTLENLSGISKLKRLQEVDVSRNKLVSLAELSSLSELRSVDASNNLLQQALDFGAPLCNNEQKTIVRVTKGDTRVCQCLVSILT